MIRFPPDANIATMTKEIDLMQEEVRTTLRAAPRRSIVTRPPSGDWSVMDNVRHLVFVEQLHFRRFYDVQWSPLGWNDRKKPEMAAVGTKTPKSIEELLVEWKRVHNATRRALKGRGDNEIREAVYRNWRHLRNHKRVIERLLRQHERTQR